MTIEIPASLPIPYRAALTAARPFLSWVVALDTYRELYARAARSSAPTFCARALDALDITLDAEPGDLLQVPSSGPTIVVANHPHGMLDGLALGRAIEQRRTDARILTNHLIAHLPGLADLCLFVDPSAARNGRARTHSGLRAARRWLDAGHTLIVFPSGTVAHRDADRRATPIDAPWHDTVARLALATGAPVVPAFVSGRNSRLFYRAGSIHALLRTLLLPRELLAKRGSRVSVRLGAAWTSSDAAGTADQPGDVMASLRAAVERLETRTESMAGEVGALAADRLLGSSGVLQVLYGRAQEIPGVLAEIGRLREVTFRAVGEGTGRARDLDAFDDDYVHLFVWNAERREVVGAYRLGLTDEIVARRGVQGLYTSTLFKYDTRLLNRLSPAIELGRSFVREEYQRSSNALLLLWKGIAAFVARSRKYRVLFGPVSISSRYGDSSQQLLKTFLAQNFYHHDLAQLVEALTPPDEQPLPHGVDPRAIADARALDSMIADLEPDGKGMPVLLRQYLRLNAALLGFNVDPAFGNALDALMMVDLADVSPAVLARYFGKTAASELMARLHGPERAKEAA